MAERIDSYQENNQADVQLGAGGREEGFDNLLSDDVVADWLMRLEREQEQRAAG